MIVHIIKTEDCPEELAERIMLLIENVVGWFNTNYHKDASPKLNVPLKSDLEVFFNLIHEFRKITKIPKEDFLLLLTQTKSLQNKNFERDEDNNIYLHLGDGTSSGYWSAEYLDGYSKVFNAVFKDIKPATKPAPTREPGTTHTKEPGTRPTKRPFKVPFHPGIRINPKPKSDGLFLPGDPNIGD